MLAKVKMESASFVGVSNQSYKEKFLVTVQIILYHELVKMNRALTLHSITGFRVPKVLDFNGLRGDDLFLVYMSASS